MENNLIVVIVYFTQEIYSSWLRIRQKKSVHPYSDQLAQPAVPTLFPRIVCPLQESPLSLPAKQIRSHPIRHFYATSYFIK